MTSIQQINKHIAHHQIEIVKGAGYFYFMPLEGAPFDTPEIESVYTTRVNGMTLKQWIAHVEGCIQ